MQYTERHVKKAQKKEDAWLVLMNSILKSCQTSQLRYLTVQDEFKKLHEVFMPKFNEFFYTKNMLCLFITYIVLQKKDQVLCSSLNYANKLRMISTKLQNHSNESVVLNRLPYHQKKGMRMKLIIAKNELILLLNKKENSPILTTEIVIPPKNHHQFNSIEIIKNLAWPVIKPNIPKMPILSCRMVFDPLYLKQTFMFIAAQNRSAKVTQKRW